MDSIEDYLRSLNPQDSDKNILIFGSEYHLWKDGEYLGVATWTKNDDVGDSFQTTTVEDSIIVHHVFVADQWELVIKKAGG